MFLTTQRASFKMQAASAYLAVLKNATAMRAPFNKLLFLLYHENSI